MSRTKQAAAFVTSLRYENLPEDLTMATKRALIDTVGCLYAGYGESVSRVLREHVGAHTSAEATIIGSGLRAAPAEAALVNGATAHALDYDDVNSAVQGHPSVAILPAALAACEVAGADGKTLIVAYVAGFEVMAMLGNAVGFGHYQRGWHPTATLGAMGAAAAAARALGLDALQTRRAFALATAQAAGPRANFGSEAKPFHAGLAARAGLVSAQLAAAGMTAQGDILDADHGFFALYTEPGTEADARIAEAAASLGKTYALGASGVDVKKFPCCFWTHRAADAVLALRADGVSAHDVRRIEVNVPTGGLTALPYHRPRSGGEGKFSMEHVVATALLDGDLPFAAFTDEAVNRADVDAMRTRVVARECQELSSGAPGLSDGHVVVRLELEGGGRVERAVSAAAGSAKSPLSIDGLGRKFHDCLARAGVDSFADRLLEGMLAMDTFTSVAAWMHELPPAAHAPYKPT